MKKSKLVKFSTVSKTIFYNLIQNNDNNCNLDFPTKTTTNGYNNWDKSNVKYTIPKQLTKLLIVMVNIFD